MSKQKPKKPAKRGGWPSRERVTFPLRLDPATAEALTRVAEAHRKTRNEVISEVLTALAGPDVTEAAHEYGVAKMQLLDYLGRIGEIANKMPRSEDRDDLVFVVVEALQAAAKLEPPISRVIPVFTYTAPKGGDR